MSPKKKAVDYTTLTTTADKVQAIAGAGSMAELEAMEKQWTERGMSPIGILAGRILARKGDFRELRPEELERLERIRASRTAGAKLAPARAKGR